MKGEDLLSLLQLAVGINLGFTAILSFLGSFQAETERHATSAATYIQSNVAEQDRRTDDYLDAFSELCALYNQYQYRIGRLKAETAFYESVFLHIAFGVLTLLSLVLLIVFSALADTSIHYGWLVVSSLLNVSPLILAFALSFVYSKYYFHIRPLLRVIFRTMRRLEGIKHRPPAPAHRR